MNKSNKQKNDLMRAMVLIRPKTPLELEHVPVPNPEKGKSPHQN